MLKRNYKSILVLGCLIGFSGCSTHKDLNVVYSSTTTAGFSITKNSLNIGFRNQDRVTIPVAVQNKNNKGITKISALNDKNSTDTLSVFATFAEDFGNDKKNPKNMTLGIDKFVSTGVAAQNLSEIYKHKESNKSMKLKPINIKKNKEESKK